MTLTVKMLLNVNASFPILSSFGMDKGVGFLERNNIWPVFFLFEKSFFKYLHLDLKGILDPVHLHFKGEEIEAQGH